MNSELRAEYDKLAADFTQIKEDLKVIVEEEVENVQKKLEKSENFEQTDDLKPEPVVEETGTNMVVLSQEMYRFLFSETRTQLKKEASLIN